jgi:DNA repair photolyase
MRIGELSCRTALSRSGLPGLDYSLNPYRGCQHGCIYCYSPETLREKRDWGSFVEVKRNIPSVLAKELGRMEKGVVGLGTVTDAYQPLEERFEVTRRCLEQLLKRDFPICIQTKSSLVLKDIDLIKRFSAKEVGLTITTLDEGYSSIFEPLASPPKTRLATLSKLASEGIDTWVFIGPIIPLVTDDDLECLISEIANSGANKVIADRLRLRGRIQGRIEKALKTNNKDLIENIKPKLNSTYFKKVQNTISQLCEMKGIRCVSAFQDR